MCLFTGRGWGVFYISIISSSLSMWNVVIKSTAGAEPLGRKSLSRPASDGVLINADKVNNFPKRSIMWLYLLWLNTLILKSVGQARTWRRSNAEFIAKPPVTMNWSQKLEFLFFFCRSEDTALLIRLIRFLLCASVLQTAWIKKKCRKDPTSVAKNTTVCKY